MRKVLSTKEFAAVLKLTYVENCLRSAIKFIKDDDFRTETAVDKSLIATKLELQATLTQVTAIKNIIKGVEDEPTDEEQG